MEEAGEAAEEAMDSVDVAVDSLAAEVEEATEGAAEEEGDQ